MVSVVVPVYNGEKYINRCINCILEQTERDIELIIVNDGSTDCTKQIIQSRALEIEKGVESFIYVEQENQGVGAAVRLGLEKIGGGIYAYMMWMIYYFLTPCINNDVG